MTPRANNPRMVGGWWAFKWFIMCIAVAALGIAVIAGLI